LGEANSFVLAIQMKLCNALCVYVADAILSNPFKELIFPIRGELLMTISYVISTLAELLILAIIIRALLSWFSGVSALQPISRFFNRVTDPLIEPIRRRLPSVGGLDFSPLVALVLIWLAETILLIILAGH
jgi:YggT family protein